MGLFDAKFCDFCGNKIGLLGNHKLGNGNMCKNCYERVSKWAVDTKNWSVENMEDHLKYRDANFERMRTFRVTDTIGRDKYKLYIDQDKQCFFVSQYSNYRDENPDIFDFNQVTDVRLVVRDNPTQLYFRTPDGRRVPYVPAEYDYNYDFTITVYLRDCPFTNQISFKLNTFQIDDAECVEFYEIESDAEAMRIVFEGMARANGRRVNLSIPAPYRVDNITRQRMAREKDLRRQAKKDRMYAYEHGPAFYPGRPGTPPRPGAGPHPGPGPSRGPQPGPGPNRGPGPGPHRGPDRGPHHGPGRF